ncbi:MAG: D-isomer specific 2-hydroxyacid dehydrogenase family protein [Oscillospiraceae bacterium]|nr:D-isomer specific 2-hydroxyacid dehydrogenase family protein [Oscillospiraceae bacterium]
MSELKITAYEVRPDEEPLLEQLSERHGFILQATDKPLTMETLSLAEGSVGVTTLGQSEMSEALFKALAALGVKGYSTRTVGYNHVDLNGAKKYGVQVSNASYAPNGVADYTVMLMLMSLRCYKPALYRINVNDYSLEGLMGRELRNLTVGVVGTGRIGRAVIENLSGFGCRILAHSLHPSEDLKAKVTFVDMDTLYRESDILTLHTKLTDITYHMINQRTIAKMKPGIILINCARGELMDIEAVTEGIENQRLGGLALDVFENENGIYHRDLKTSILKNRDMAYLRQFPNVVMTQHMAFYTKEAVESMARCGVESLLAFARGEDWPDRLC